MSYGHAVGGHANTLQNGLTSATVIKPCLDVEQAFYSVLGPRLFPDSTDDSSSGFIGTFTPAYYGLLTAKDDQPVPHDQKKMIVLENLTWRFLRPNILDVKLGTQLYDDDASDEKKQRMVEAAKATTSLETGVRLTGMQTWNPQANDFVRVDKSYGKSITKDQLPDGIRRFFAPNHSPLPLEYQQLVLKLVLRKIDAIYERVRNIEWRIRGSSLLIVYEGDLDAFTASCSPDDENSLEQQDEEDEEEDSQGDCKPKYRIPFDVRLIDFAHTRAAHGEGPDRGFLLGIETTRKLIQDLLQDLNGQ